MSFFMHCASDCRVYGLDALAKTSGFIKMSQKAQCGSPVAQQEMRQQILDEKGIIL
jgi:hypothetical protein